jgi:hypothetical protein
VKGDVLINSETFLMIDFMNLKIKPTQSFECTHKDRVYIRVFIGVSAHIYIYEYLCLKKTFTTHRHVNCQPLHSVLVVESLTES